MENLNSLELVEIKALCKKHGIGTVGDKKTLIKNLKYYLDPIEDVLNSHPGRKLPKDKKIIGKRLSAEQVIEFIEKGIE